MALLGCQKGRCQGSSIGLSYCGATFVLCIELLCDGAMLDSGLLVGSRLPDDSGAGTPMQHGVIYALFG